VDDRNPTSTMPAFRGTWWWEAVFESQDDGEVGVRIRIEGDFDTPHQAEQAAESMDLPMECLRLMVGNGGPEIVRRAGWEIR